MFDKILCINLDHRTDRWEESQKEFSALGWDVDRYPACEGDNRMLAFNKSQFFSLCYAKHFNTALILEDDVAFKNTEHLGEAMYELPSDWDILYLGANIVGLDGLSDWKHPTGHSKHLKELHDAFQTHAIAYSKKMMEWIVENFIYWKDEYKTEGLMIFDEWLRQNVLRGDFKSFIINPQVAYQRKSFSDLWQVEADYSSCFERGNKIML